MQHLVEIVSILMCCIVLVVGAQIINEPQSQHIQSNERRRYFSGDYSDYGSSSASLASAVPSDFIRFPEDRSISSATVNIQRNENSRNNFNDHHKTNTHEAIIESDKIDTVRGEESCSESGCSMPIDFFTPLDTFDDYFKSLDAESQSQLELIAPRGAFGVDVERSQIRQAKPASCIPQLAVVELKLNDESDLEDPTIFIYPSCTRIEQCGGCCGSNLLSCQPIASEKVYFQAYKSQRTGRETKFLGREVVEVDRHTKCRCDCKIKESDCKYKQRYNKPSCSCVCTNIEDQRKCLKEDADKIWESDTCKCKCREEIICSTDTFFNTNTCTCQEKPGFQDNRDVPNVDRRRMITKPVIYVPQTPQTQYDSISETEPQPSQ